VHDDLRSEDKEDKLEQAEGKGVLDPIVTVLQHLQGVKVEGNLVIKVFLHECLHGDLVATAVGSAIGLILEGEVELNGTTWQLDLLILAGAEIGEDVPVATEDGNSGDEAKEDGSLQSTANLPRQVCWDNGDEAEEGKIGEAVGSRTISRKRSILDSGRLCNGLVIDQLTVK
jgi:hypothetical protein